MISRHTKTAKSLCLPRRRLRRMAIFRWYKPVCRVAMRPPQPGCTRCRVRKLCGFKSITMLAPGATLISFGDLTPSMKLSACRASIRYPRSFTGTADRHTADSCPSGRSDNSGRVVTEPWRRPASPAARHQPANPATARCAVALRRKSNPSTRLRQTSAQFQGHLAAVLAGSPRIDCSCGRCRWGGWRDADRPRIRFHKAAARRSHRQRPRSNAPSLDEVFAIQQHLAW